jgi:hypothetical protein
VPSHNKNVKEKVPWNGVRGACRSVVFLSAHGGRNAYSLRPVKLFWDVSWPF